MWPFKPRQPPPVTASALWNKWFVPLIPEGHPSLDAYEGLITDEERTRLPKTMLKLALDGVDRIYGVRKAEVSPDRAGLVFMDELLDTGLRHNLVRDQNPADPRSLLRIVATEFGCIVGEVYEREKKGVWVLQRSPNLWRSQIRLNDDALYDPFRAVITQLSDDKEEGGLVRRFDSA